MTIKERMQRILTVYKSNPTQLAKLFKVNQKTLNSQINGETAVSASTLIMFLEAFDISAEWLMRGEGEMLRSAKVSADGEAEKLRMENQMLRDEIIQLHIQLAQLRAKPQKMAAG
ncbi:MAG: hypothetical protein PUC25_02375 [Prevotellaceae bacterium]|nr:hypothetical protein [Prevotellaceae bacterium]